MTLMPASDSSRQGDDGEVEKRKKRQLPRNADHHDEVEDDEERFAERDLQGVGDAELHDVDVGGDFGNDVALALVAEVGGVHVDHAREHVVADALEGRGAEFLDGPCAQVAEQVAQQARYDGDGGQQNQHVLDAVFVENVRIAVVEQGFEVGRVEGQGRQLLHGPEREVGPEHGVEDGYDEQERAGIEQRVKQRIEEVGDGVAPDGPGETQEPEVCFEHADECLSRREGTKSQAQKQMPRSGRNGGSGAGYGIRGIIASVCYSG